MTISNTSILIKRSTANSSPGTLKAGELGYSYVSNTFFIGNSTGTGVVNVGGLYYTSQIDNATPSNTPSTLVKRDASGNVTVNYIIATGASFGSLTANTANLASYATQLQNPHNFSVSGGDITATAQTFNGTQDVTLSASLNSVSGLSAGFYGGSTAIPVVQVAANGRIMAISNTSLSTSFTVSGNTGSGTQNTGGTLTIEGNGSGIVTSVTGAGGSETVLIGTDTTVLRSNTSGIGTQTIGTDLSISGNLIVKGTTTTVNTTTIVTNSSLIELASNNNVGDVVDIGFYEIGRAHV